MKSDWWDAQSVVGRICGTGKFLQTFLQMSNV